MKTIRIAKVPGTVREIALNDTDNLGQALAIYASEFGETVDGYEMRLGDSVVSRDYVPADGAKVYLVLMVKGN